MSEPPIDAESDIPATLGWLSSQLRAWIEHARGSGGDLVPRAEAVCTNDAHIAQEVHQAVASTPILPGHIMTDAHAVAPATAISVGKIGDGLGRTTRRLSLLEEEARACQACGLHKGRTHSVFSRGREDSRLVFVGEGPGRDEDLQGRPFVGPAGQLLDRMITAMGFALDEVYVCNVVKCRPPDNRTPLPNEVAACGHFLEAQLNLVAPRCIVALGKCAAQYLGCVPEQGPWRGSWGLWCGIPVMPTYHPAFLLRSPQYKRPVWEDLQQVIARLAQGT